LTACSFEHGKLMNATDDARLADTTSVDTSVDAPPDGAANVDTDGDGIFDNVDNCRLVPSSNQHDEDGDATGDICDPCPQVANATADGDSDGIGDACDPHPATAGDVLVRFEPFTGTTLPSGWTVIAGSAGDFDVGNDMLTIDATSSTHFVTFDAGNKNHAIDVGVQLPATTATTVFFTAATDTKSDISQYIGCGLRIDTSVREQFAFSGGSFTTLGADPMPADAPTFPGTYRIRSVLADNSESCSIPSATNAHTMTGTAATNSRSFVGLRAGKSVAQVKYVAVYRF